MDEREYLKTKEKIKVYRWASPFAIIGGVVLLTLSIAMYFFGALLAFHYFLLLILSMVLIALGRWTKSKARKLEIDLEVNDKELVDKEKEISEKKKKKVEIKDDAFFFGQKDQWWPFQELIATANEKIDIATSTLSPEALEKILERKKKGVEFRILYGRVSGGGYKKLRKLIDFKKESKRVKRFHGKLCIADGKKVLLGSSNITRRSLGIGISGSLEADIVSEDEQVVSEAEELFNIIWEQKKNIEKLDTASNFISSAYGVPKKIMELLKEAEEVIMIVPPLFQYADKILDDLTEKNPDIKIKLITHYKIPKNYMETVEEIRKNEKIQFIPVRSYIHSKIYLFDRKTALISSVNSEFTSWCNSLETGIITHDKETVKRIMTKSKKMEEKKAKIRKGSERRTPKPRSDLQKAVDLPFKTEGERLGISEKISSKNKCTKIKEIKERAGGDKNKIERKKRISLAKKNSLAREIDHIERLNDHREHNKAEEKLIKIEEKIEKIIPFERVWKELGVISNVRRGNHPKQYIINPANNQNLDQFLGKKVRWKCKSGKYIEGKIHRKHGRHGLRAILNKGLPGEAIGTKIEYQEE